MKSLLHEAHIVWNANLYFSNLHLCASLPSVCSPMLPTHKSPLQCPWLEPMTSPSALTQLMTCTSLRQLFSLILALSSRSLTVLPHSSLCPSSVPITALYLQPVCNTPYPGWPRGISCCSINKRKNRVCSCSTFINQVPPPTFCLQAEERKAELTSSCCWDQDPKHMSAHMEGPMPKAREKTKVSPRKK